MFFLLLSLTPCLAMLFYRHPMLLLSLFPIVNVFGVFFPDYAFRSGGFVLFPIDAAYFFTIIHLSLCALLRPKKMALLLKENKLLCIFLGMILLNTILSTSVYGAQPALGEARKLYFTFLIPLLASVVIKAPEDLRRFLLILIFAATSIAIFGLALAARQGSIVRVLNSEGTLILAMVTYLILVHHLYRITLISPAVDKVLFLLFGAMVLGGGQRSVWLAIGFGLILLLWLYRKRSVMFARTIMITFVAVSALGVALVVFPEQASKLADKFGGIIDPHADANASWRIERWEYQIDRVRDGGNILFGEGLGGYYRDPFTDNLVPSPHNAYVEMIIKCGLFGLLVYGLFAVHFFRKTLSIRNTLNPGPTRAYLETGILNFAAAHTYMLGYTFTPITLMFFAVANSAAQLSRRQSVPYRAPRRQYVTTRLSPGVMEAQRGLR